MAVAHKVNKKIKLHKDYVFDITNIKKFIEINTDLIIAEINEILLTK